MPVKTRAEKRAAPESPLHPTPVAPVRRQAPPAPEPPAPETPAHETPAPRPITRPVVVKRPWGPRRGPGPSQELLDRHAKWLLEVDLDTLDFSAEMSDSEDEVAGGRRIDWEDLTAQQKWDWQVGQISDNYMAYNVKGTMLIDKVLCWNSEVFKFSIFSLDNFAILIDTKVEEKGATVISRIAVLRCSHLRATIIKVALEDFGSDEWNKVEQQVQKMWNEFLSYVSIEVVIRTTAIPRQNRAQQEEDILPSITTPSTSTRRTRTNGLLADISRIEEQERTGNHSAEITRKWLCINNHCLNFQGGLCWIDDIDGAHYIISTAQQGLWSSQINSNAGVTVQMPPAGLIAFWRQKQGEIKPTSKRSVQRLTKEAEAKEEKEKQNTEYAELMSAIRESIKMKMVNNMAKMAEPDPQHQHQYYPQHPPPQAHYVPYQAQFQPHLFPQYPASLLGQISYIQQPSQPSPQPLPPPPDLQKQATPPISSPLGSEEEDDRITAFFNWELGRVRNSDRWHKISNVRTIALQECWTVTDLKEMSNVHSELYKIACSKGVPDGIARRFKSALKQFKASYRQRRAANYLVNLQSSGGSVEGGFIR